MTTRLRLSSFSMLMLAMALTGCGHFNCATGAQFGASTCTPSSPGIGTTGGGSSAAVFAFAVDAGVPGATSGTIDGFTLNTSAQTFQTTPAFDPPAIPANDFGTGMVVAQSQFLYTGFASTQQIFGWTIGSDGSLAAISGSPYPAAFMTGLTGQIGTYSIITNPAGTLLFFADTFDARIYVYQIGAGGVLSLATTSPVSVSFAPLNMTTDGLGRYLYVTEDFGNHQGFEIWAYSIASDGSLAAISGSPFPFPMWQVQGDPSGNFLIGTTGETAGVNGADDSHLYLFNIAQSGAAPGAISAAAGSPFATTYSPFSIAVQTNTNGNLIYSFGVNDTLTGFNPIEGFHLTNGLLAVDNGSPFSNVSLGSQGAFDQSGAFLFDFSAVTDVNTGVTTYQLGALDVASDGSLTQPTSPLTLATGGFWAVTDPK
jgi:hypothetical protein